MKIGFYPRLAADGIRKNKRMYLPYILTCIGMVMMQYIIAFLQYSDTLSYLPGADIARSMIGMGVRVISIFACIFLFYTNSFLMRRRKKEFGLYNMLGMGKRNIGLILVWEYLIISVISVVLGLAGGIAFSKLAELGLVNLMKGEVTYAISISVKSVLLTAKTFAVIFVLLFLNSIRQVRFSNAISLLKSENVGEKPPKSNWILGIIGVVVLAGAYYIAVTIEDPVAALTVFFLAVVMVIIGTYLLMIAGSVLLCRVLQKRKSYYYKAKHFVSTSSMAYRMKRNGAGLASICILATMVLVMISSTAALYFGSEETLNNRYPKDINMEFTFTDAKALSEGNIENLRNDISDIADKYGAVPKNINDYRCATVTGYIDGETVETDISKAHELNFNTYSNVNLFFIVPLSDYNAMMGTNETLSEGEALVYKYRSDFNGETIAFNGGEKFRIKKYVDEYFGSGEAAMNILSSIIVIVPDFDSAIAGLDELYDSNGNKMLKLSWERDFDTGVDKETQLTLTDELKDRFDKYDLNGKGGYAFGYTESREAEKDSYYGLFGGMFYLGIILSIVFVFATVLIIYYKQVSEGYEDQSRFEIMQKVGMTKKEIRKSINSQLLTVFFLPLVGAGVHLAFAFPIIRKLLLMFNLNNVTLFAATTAISFLAFALFYTIVYRITSNAYYKIVSGARAD